MECDRKTANEQSYKQNADKLEEEDDMAGAVTLGQISTSPQQVKTIACCSQRKRFTTTTMPNHTPLRLEMEMLHSVSLNATGSNIVIAK